MGLLLHVWLLNGRIIPISRIWWSLGNFRLLSGTLRFGYNFRYSAGTNKAQTHFLENSMATLVKTPSGRWKAIIRRAGWPMTVKTFRTQRDAGDWARRTEDDMVRGAFIQRAPGDRMTVAVAMKRYLSDVVPTKRPTTQVAAC